MNNSIENSEGVLKIFIICRQCLWTDGMATLYVCCE